MNTWRIAQARSLGTSHIADNIPCQDYHLADCIDDGAATYLLIAVADGAGSAARSGDGAKKACDAAMLHLKEHAAELAAPANAREVVTEAFSAALRAIIEFGECEAIEIRQLASTLLVAVVASDFTVFGQVGDGAFVCDVDDKLNVPYWPDQIALNLTDFITSAPLEQILHVQVVPRKIMRLACMTDGLAPLLLDFRTKSPHVPIFERLFSTCQAAPDPSDLDDDLEVFISSAAVNERTDDDKTLILAIRQEQGLA